MDKKNRRLGYAARAIVGGAGIVLLVLFALSAYVIWSINGKYLHDYDFPHIGWPEALWLIVALYLALVGSVGTWRPTVRTDDK
ncbi:hypothetical protein NX784_05960 [Massilia pinisoli]|uniref:Uncharacterized protein n=1 Tax=Massilia pinisoli TaxID=1772194 RepID=A0ABT1ZML6_9BURK|nr:hypothetical protein [Massilia pinisoli]MCS0581130.1 hypothetical protein [Massilia pinisoli]